MGEIADERVDRIIDDALSTPEAVRNFLAEQLAYSDEHDIPAVLTIPRQWGTLKSDAPAPTPNRTGLKLANTTPAKLLARMQDMAEEQITNDFTGCFYGPIGSGKTTFVMGLAQALADGGRILYFDSSDGWVSLQQFPSLLENAVRIRFETLADLTVTAEAIRKRSKGFEDIKVVVIDEGSSIANEVLYDVVRDKHGVGKDEILPDIEGKDYGPMGQLYMAALNRLHAVEGLHILIVAHDAQRKDHRNVEVTYPDFSPKLRKEVMKLMHVVGFVSSQIRGAGKKTEYVREIQLQPTALIQAKARFETPLKLDFPDTIEAVTSWVNGENFAADLAGPELQVEAEEDELPTDGIPVADNPEDDDEPAYTEELN